MCLDNRPFLRALHGVALAHARLRRHRDAAAMMERLLAYNPNDNQGVRYLLGSEYLHLAETDKVPALLEAEAATILPTTSWRSCTSRPATGWRRPLRCDGVSARTPTSWRFHAATRTLRR